MKIPEFKLERFFARYEFNAPYLLCCSDLESLTVSELLTLPKTPTEKAESLENLWLGYTESKGAPELRHEIRKLYEQLDSDDILVHTGAEEGIFNFMHTVLAPGDHIIVQYPCYQSLFEIAAAIGCEVTRWRPSLSGNTSDSLSFQWDADFLKKSITPKTRAIVINSPHNPTGCILGKTMLDDIAHIAEYYGIHVLSDEVYRFSEYDEKDRHPSMADLTERGVSLGVMSKSFGLAGLRIGWLALKNKALYNKMAALKDYTTICNSAPSEFLATFALKNKVKLLERNNGIIKNNLETLIPFFQKYNDIFTWIPPMGSALAFPVIKNVENSESFTQKLVEQTGVLLMPGIIYGNAYKNHFRIGFGRKNMPECLGHLANFLNQEY